MKAAIVTLLLAGGLATPLAAQEGSEAPFYAGRPLVEVLQDLNRRGLRIVFSSSLVPVTLRVSSEPSGTPREILDQVLRPQGLPTELGEAPGTLRLIPLGPQARSLLLADGRAVVPLPS